MLPHGLQIRASGENLQPTEGSSAKPIRAVILKGVFNEAQLE